MLSDIALNPSLRKSKHPFDEHFNYIDNALISIASNYNRANDVAGRVATDY